SPHVGKEIERASSKQHPIFAVRTDTAALTPAFEYFLSESQWIDVTDGGIDAATTKLTSAIRKRASSNLSFDSSTPVDSIPSRTVRASRPRVWGTAFLVALVVALSVGLALIWRGTNNSPTDPVRTRGLEDPLNWTVFVQPFTVPADGSLDAIAEIALN